MSAWIVVAATLVLMSVAVLVVYVVGGRAKQRLDTPLPAVKAHDPVVLTLTPANATRAGKLSREPIVVKQTAEGVRVQLENRPLLPLSMFTDLDAMAALREIAVRITQRFGTEWTALVTVEDDGSVSARRIA